MVAYTALGSVVEQRPFKPLDIGSNPISGTTDATGICVGNQNFLSNDTLERRGCPARDKSTERESCREQVLRVQFPLLTQTEFSSYVYLLPE